MQIALLLAREIAQLFLILLAGFVLVRAGLLRAADSKVLSVILVYLVIPCVIVDAFQIEDTPAIRAGLALSFGAAAAIHLLFLLLTWLLRRPLGLDAIERATAIYSNAGALVIPLVQALLGQEYVIYSCAFIIVQLVLLWTHGAAILRGAGKAVAPMVIMMFFWCVVRVAFLAVSIPMTHSIQMVYLVYPLTWSLSSIAFFFYYKKANWMDLTDAGGAKQAG